MHVRITFLNTSYYFSYIRSYQNEYTFDNFFFLYSGCLFINHLDIMKKKVQSHLIDILCKQFKYVLL